MKERHVGALRIVILEEGTGMRRFRVYCDAEKSMFGMGVTLDEALAQLTRRLLDHFVFPPEKEK